MEFIEEVPLFPTEEQSSNDWANEVFECSVPLFGDIDGGESTIREATIKAGKYYVDEAKTISRIEFKLESKEAIIKLNPDEKYLSEILDCIPYGLINKRLTGIGATTLEMKSDRNSIIVTPTRTLAYNKYQEDPDNYLYVGTHPNGKGTSEEEIITYLKNESIPYKKILVVADSLKRLIETIEKNGNKPFKDFFLMVDEIDTLQSDNHFRPQLSKVIDYYFKFRPDKRALVSATIKKFSHPKIKGEPFITIDNVEQQKKIDLLYTHDINTSLANKIQEITNKYSSEKILIAYNSVKNCIKTILQLPAEIQDQCGILCSEASYNEIGNYKASIAPKTNILSHKITFITCAFFTGVDIMDKCHLITVSNIERGYSALSIHKMKQIAGRCRTETLSNTIIYNSSKKPLNKQNSYKERLLFKAQKVVDYINSADKLKSGDADLIDLFNRIKKVIIEKADERFFYDVPVNLVRENIDGEAEISYFNIDALCEKMELYSSLYASKEELYNQLSKFHDVVFKEDESLIGKDVIDSVEYISGDKKVTQHKVRNAIDKVIELEKEEALNDDYLNKLIRQSKRTESELYKRVKNHYKYIDVDFLTELLYDISVENKKSYRGVRNAISFHVLDNKHPFKQQVIKAFPKGKKYSSTEIEEILQPIIKYHFFQTLPISQINISRSRLMNLFNSFIKTIYTGGKYLIKGLNPKNIPAPKIRISANEEVLHNYFEI